MKMIEGTFVSHPTGRKALGTFRTFPPTPLFPLPLLSVCRSFFLLLHTATTEKENITQLNKKNIPTEALRTTIGFYHSVEELGNERQWGKKVSAWTHSK